MPGLTLIIGLGHGGANTACTIDALEKVGFDSSEQAKRLGCDDFSRS